MADLFQKCHHDLLEEVKSRNIYPYFHTLESRQAPVVEMEGKQRIMLGPHAIRPNRSISVELYIRYSVC